MLVATRITIRETEGIDGGVSGEAYSADSLVTTDQWTVVLTLSRTFLTAEEDPVLAELWDNEEDAVYDDV